MIREKILKICLLSSFFSGMIFTGYSQNVMVGAEDPSVTDKSDMGLTILLIIAGLAVVLLAVRYLGKMMDKGKVQAVKPAVAAEVPAVTQPDPQGEINAAIAMALYLYSNELHDQENPVITMIRVSKTYSPWSSKIYGLRKLPR